MLLSCLNLYFSAGKSKAHDLNNYITHERSYLLFTIHKLCIIRLVLTYYTCRIVCFIEYKTLYTDLDAHVVKRHGCGHAGDLAERRTPTDRAGCLRRRWWWRRRVRGRTGRVRHVVPGCARRRRRGKLHVLRKRKPDTGSAGGRAQVVRVRVRRVRPAPLLCVLHVCAVFRHIQRPRLLRVP